MDLEPMFVEVADLVSESSTWGAVPGCPAFLVESTSTAIHSTPAVSDGAVVIAMDPEPPAIDTATSVEAEPGHAAKEALVAAAGKTTVRLSNLPFYYHRDLLVGLLAQEGLEGTYDFVYLPMDFVTGQSRGYAFINFSNERHVLSFFNVFEGFTKWAARTDKAAAVGWSNIQGLQCNQEYFKNSFLLHQDVPDGFRPALFSGGERVRFPPPDRRQQRRWVHQIRATPGLRLKISADEGP